MLRDRDNHLSLGRNALLKGTTLAAIVIGGAGCDILGGSDNQQGNDGRPTASASPEELPHSDEASPEKVLQLYQESRDINNEYFNYRRQGLSQEELRVMSNGLTVAKVRAMWAHSSFPQDPFVKNEGHTIIFNGGRKLNLENPNDFENLNQNELLKI